MSLTVSLSMLRSLVPEHVLDCVHVQVLNTQGPGLALPHVVVKHGIEHRRPASQGKVSVTIGSTLCCGSGSIELICLIRVNNSDPDPI